MADGGREHKEKLAHARLENSERRKKNCCSARTLKYSVTNRVDLYCSGNGRGHLRGGGRGWRLVRVRCSVWACLVAPWWTVNTAPN